MQPENILVKWLKKLKCKLGFHDFCTYPDGHIKCWECGKEKK